ncbi:MAG: hypothetical protein HY537_00535 [Deltaproteobacteria bacterium]|nr:hypothetical protein [Deltaproteobacteria bacterium]
MALATPSARAEFSALDGATLGLTAAQLYKVFEQGKYQDAKKKTQQAQAAVDADTSNDKTQLNAKLDQAKKDEEKAKNDANIMGWLKGLINDAQNALSPSSPTGTAQGSPGSAPAASDPGTRRFTPQDIAGGDGVPPAPLITDPDGKITRLDGSNPNGPIDVPSTLPDNSKWGHVPGSDANAYQLTNPDGSKDLRNVSDPIRNPDNPNELTWNSTGQGPNNTSSVTANYDQSTNKWIINYPDGSTATAAPGGQYWDYSAPSSPSASASSSGTLPPDIVTPAQMVAPNAGVPTASLDSSDTGVNTASANLPSANAQPLGTFPNLQAAYAAFQTQGGTGTLYTVSGLQGTQAWTIPPGEAAPIGWSPSSQR